MKNTQALLYVIVLFLGCTFGLLSCQNQQEQSQLTIEEQALNLIQNKQYDAALIILNKALKESPTDKLRQLTASTYAAKAGIFVEDYWGFLAGYKTPVVGNQDLSHNSEYLKMKSVLQKLNPIHFSESTKAFDLIFQNLAKFQVYAERLEAIPKIDELQSQFLEQGLAVLKPAQSAGAKLYDSLLWLIIIRKSISEGASHWLTSIELLQNIDLQHLESESNRKLICSIDHVGFVKWINNLAQAISRVSTDLAVAYPSQAEEFSHAQVWLNPLIQLSVTGGSCQ